MLIVFLFVGCNKNEQNNKVYLDKEFYNSNEFIAITRTEVEELKNTKSVYVLYTYNNYCSLPIPCEDIFKNFMEKYNISFYSIPYSEFKETYLNDTVKYAPSIIIVENGEIIDYLDANSDADYDYYQDLNKFTVWMEKYLYLSN